MKKYPIFFEGIHEYDLEVDDNLYTLYHNQADCWVADTRGTIAFQIKDTGNEITFKTDKKNMLNYSEAMYMYLILSFKKDYKLEIYDTSREL